MITDEEFKAMKAAISRGRVFDWRWEEISGGESMTISVMRSFEDPRILELNDYIKEQIIVAMNGFSRLVEEVERLREHETSCDAFFRGALAMFLHDARLSTANKAAIYVKTLTTEIESLRSENAALLAEVAELRAGAK